MSKRESPATPPTRTLASAVIETIKLDVNTIKIVVLTAAVVVALLSVPLLFVLRNFVTFDALDDYFKVTDSVRPKILRAITAGLDTGYSRNFIISSTSTDSTMLFYALPHQKATLSVSAQSIGPFPQISLLVNNCLFEERSEPFDLYEKELTDQLDKCNPDKPNLHTLRIVVPGGLQKGTQLQMRCLVLVYQRIHDP
jgi:hypothetical protein